MGIASEIRQEVKKIFKTAWTTRKGTTVPDVDDLKLGNDAVTFEAVVLYADMADSTWLATNMKESFAAEVYKSYLVSACRCIRENEGEITAFDGDRVMGVFVEGNKNTNAAKTALNISWCRKLINEEIKDYYSSIEYTLKQSVGVDKSKVFVARTGIRGSNDLVWVGGAPNYAAKLCALRDGAYASWITEPIYQSLLDSSKCSNGTDMWTRREWTEYNRIVYASTWTWEP